VSEQLGPRRRLTLRLRHRLENAVSRGPRSIADVAREYAVSWWSANQALIDRAADVLDTQAVDEGSNAFTASRKRPGDTLGSVYATAEAVLDVYTDPQVAASADGCDQPGHPARP
jgi:Helix-turn-helix domain of transposase family ISL3